ncbi:hypothetical protein Cob_v004228 [Colletotrichum orbiculare MAFF 240422]|uniref:Uncharacterized protein n=1 Tax=Colletotrichum orbiculare (strain 104-T / ATCC 96160 / CBS 514.97 / LARS 414 / MAFF 240422) TaxID=1213857 RepID=A0A484FYP3_COLOR|nr:hypothetical protein Cob_v004228 [Colletotrichum orbiculare MAFF 240422]
MWPFWVRSFSVSASAEGAISSPIRLPKIQHLRFHNPPSFATLISPRIAEKHRDPRGSERLLSRPRSYTRGKMLANTIDRLQ